MRLLFPQMDLLLIIENRVFPQACKYWTPGKNFLSAVFLTTSSLITSINTGSGEGHLRHWQPLAKQRLPLASHDCVQALLEKKAKVVVPTGPSVQHPFFDSLHFHHLCLRTIETSHVPSLHVTSPCHCSGRAHLLGSAAGSTTHQKSLLHSANLGQSLPLSRSTS